jgi:hypothetical protein
MNAPRIAVITTVYSYLSHAQHFVDRFLVGYPYEGMWRDPSVNVVSMYIDQRPVGDQSADRAREFGFTMYPTITEALRCGGDDLAVDGVLIICEHGDYGRNALGQILYPRYEWFKECVAVFEEDGRSVPVYNDKHLSYDYTKAEEMVDDAKRLNFSLMAGSAVPVTWRLPDLELEHGCVIEEALVIGWGGSDPTDYHALEGLQCMIERRRNGETGVSAVQMLEGAAVWSALDQTRWSPELLEAALSRSDSPQGLSIEDGRTQDLLGSGELQKLVEEPVAYLIEFRDGLRATLLMLNGAITEFCFAARLEGSQTPVSCQFLVTPKPNVNYSASLVAKIDEMFSTGQAPIPADRTLAVGGYLQACLQSRHQGGVRLETPHLSAAYTAPIESHHARQ